MFFFISGKHSEECIPHSITKERQAKGITISKQALFILQKNIPYLLHNSTAPLKVYYYLFA
jgi:hypothetical protein